MKLSDLKINKLASELAENTAELNTHTVQITANTNAITGISASPKGSYANLSAIQTAFPTGNNNVYLSLDDGKWNYWNGSAWTAGGLYQNNSSVAALSSEVDSLNNYVQFQLTNGVSNGDFSNGLTGWTAASSTLSVASGIASFTLTGANGGIDQAIANYANYKGHVVYFACDFQTSSSNGNLLLNDGVDQVTVTHSGDNIMRRYSGIKTVSSSATGLSIKVRDFEANSTAVTQCDNFLCIDLTATFGAGKEPTISEFEELLAYFSNSWFDGTVNLANHKWFMIYLLNKIKSNKYELQGKKVTVLGDSITFKGTKWLTDMANLTGATFLNYGVSGTPIQNSADNNGFIQRYTQIPSDTDIIIVEGGTNDWGNNYPYGTLDYTDHTDTLCGALNILFKGLQTNYPNAKIYICTPPQRNFQGTTTQQGMGANNYNWTFEDCQNAIKTMARYYGLEVIDFFANLGWSANNVLLYTEDGLHPNDVGYDRMTDYTIKRISR